MSLIKIVYNKTFLYLNLDTIVGFKLWDETIYLYLNLSSVTPNILTIRKTDDGYKEIVLYLKNKGVNISDLDPKFSYYSDY